RLTPADAYRFARGEKITANNGMQARLQRPLDFLVVADHAENMGVVAALDTADISLLKTQEGRQLYDRFQSARQQSGDPSHFPWLNLFTEGVRDIGYRQSIWDSVAANAEMYNEPGRFTAFIGYEWSAASIDGATGYSGIHRVVIFKDGAQKATKMLPISNLDSNNPEDLWAHLASYESNTGGEVLAIPHNGNYSKGRMFLPVRSNGQPIDQAYAMLRSRWEPLYEVTQIKGDTETHPVLSAADEFADFETWTGSISEGIAEASESADIARQYEYARSALKLGLEQKRKLGVNPFKFGMIGSTDSHTALSTADNNNFFGKFTLVEPSATRLGPIFPQAPNGKSGSSMNAAGYAAVWATENTREALFAAMKRKEVYASTGPRMTVRFFGGWDYEKEDAFKPDLVDIGYTKGVPMGGDLTHAPKGKSPKFLIRAVKDPDGANLDRVQVIKGWHDKNGELHEKIYNVALSDNRKENWRGKVKPVGSTVDIKDASYTNTIGDSELAVVWTDPDFNQDEPAFYYVRVLEIPTPRWTAYDAKYFDLKDIPEEIPMVTQERAYTSPIWYSPASFAQ
ncbi:DUF3604 domain-containing protein, partial [Porticoccaceae bacterium]|nr:DUF3604 domain-containing protein [Porticoccaceae bacterium]